LIEVLEEFYCGDSILTLDQERRKKEKGCPSRQPFEIMFLV
jgi:hypothetical protein